MINIAVCDDDVQFAAALEEKILDYGKRKVSGWIQKYFQMGKFSAGCFQ